MDALPATGDPTSPRAREQRLAFFAIVLADHDLLASAFEEVVAELTVGAPPTVLPPAARVSSRRPHVSRNHGAPATPDSKRAAAGQVPAERRWARSPP